MKLSEALSDIQREMLVLPEFQREYVWDREQAKKLVAALVKGWPVGSMLIWKTDTPPELKNSNKTGGVSVLLDGQQRLTTLYMLMKGEIPPYYRSEDIQNDPRDLCVNLESWEFQYYQASKMDDDGRWWRVRDCFDASKFSDILAAFTACSKKREKVEGEDEKEDASTKHLTLLIQNLNKLGSISNFELTVQVVPTDSNLTDAITIFDWTNSQGTKLTDAELALTHVTAKWPQARRVLKAKIEELKKRGFLFDLTFMTRALTVAVTGRALFPAVHGEQKDRLENGWKLLSKVLDYLVAFLPQHAFINSQADLSSPNALIPLIAYLCRSEGKFPDQKSIDHAVNWLHTALIWGRYAGQTDQRLEADIAMVAREVAPWDSLRKLIIEQRGRTGVQDADFAARGVYHPLYKAAFALAKANGAADWFNGLPLRENAGQSYKMHSHHIFPQALLYRAKAKGGAGFDAGNTAQKQLVNEIANRAYLTADSNWGTSDTPPSVYLPEIERKFPGSLAKQFIPDDPELWKVERFEDFLAQRRKLIAANLNEFLDGLIAEPDAVAHRPITELIALGESATLEFKSSWQWDMRAKGVNRQLRFSSLKTIAAFLNSEGGTLIIGVEDDGSAIGIGYDLSPFQGSVDRYEQKLRQDMIDTMGTLPAKAVTLRFDEVGGNQVCVVEVEPSRERVYCMTEKGQELFCRVGNTTRSLTLEEAESYLESHWGN